jgi:hypothetical protein
MSNIWTFSQRLSRCKIVPDIRSINTHDRVATASVQFASKGLLVYLEAKKRGFHDDSPIGPGAGANDCRKIVRASKAFDIRSCDWIDVNMGGGCDLSYIIKSSMCNFCYRLLLRRRATKSP